MYALPKAHHARGTKPCAICGRLMMLRRQDRVFCGQFCRSIARGRRLGQVSEPATDGALLCGRYLEALRRQRDSLARFLEHAGVAVDPEDVAEPVVP